MGFPLKIKIEALTRSRRYCCLCHQFAGLYVNVHHIVPESKDGPNTLDNAIVVCLRCHGEVGHFNPQHPIGNMYTPAELIRRRDEWYKICRENPWVMFGGYPTGESPQKLIDEGRWAALRNMVMREVEHITQGLSQEELAFGPAASGDLGQVVEAYEAVCGGLSALFMMLCQNDQPQCVDLAVECLDRVINLSQSAQQPRLHLYPALLILYSGGIGAVLGKSCNLLKALLYNVKVKSEQDDEAAVALTTRNVMDWKYQGMLPSDYHGYFRLSHRLCEILRDGAKQHLFLEGDGYEACFDRFEYVHNLAHADLLGPFDSMRPLLWPHLGYFVIRRNNTDFLDKIEEEIGRDGEVWPPLRAGFCQGDSSRLAALTEDFHERIRSFYNSQYCLFYRS